MNSSVSAGIMRTDVRIKRIALYYIPVVARMPLAFGKVRMDGVHCLRVALDVENGNGRKSRGWGEIPLNVQWMWPQDEFSYEQRLQGAHILAQRIAVRLPETLRPAHPLEISSAFIEDELPDAAEEAALRIGAVRVPPSFSLGIYSAFDLALYDAYGQVNDIPVSAVFSPSLLRHDLRFYLDNSPGSAGQYPGDYLRKRPLRQLYAWHLVGCEDPLEDGDLSGEEPRDGYPVLLADWIRTDGLRYIKIKLCGADGNADYSRLVRIGRIALRMGIRGISVDFNGQAGEPRYVRQLLERLRRDEAGIFDLLLFVEQPFAADLYQGPSNVSRAGLGKPLIIDESALDWRTVRDGAELGYRGAALKICKTFTGMILAYCWMVKRELKVVVQDLTNPMLAQLAHLQLAANLYTDYGVETNSMQYYPRASLEEAQVHPGAYQRRRGQVVISTVRGAGFGYRTDEIGRVLPQPEYVAETLGSGKG